MSENRTEDKSKFGRRKFLAAAGALVAAAAVGSLASRKPVESDSSQAQTTPEPETDPLFQELNELNQKVLNLQISSDSNALSESFREIIYKRLGKIHDAMNLQPEKAWTFLESDPNKLARQHLEKLISEQKADFQNILKEFPGVFPEDLVDREITAWAGKVHAKATFNSDPSTSSFYQYSFEPTGQERTYGLVSSQQLFTETNQPKFGILIRNGVQAGDKILAGPDAINML